MDKSIRILDNLHTMSISNSFYSAGKSVVLLSFKYEWVKVDVGRGCQSRLHFSFIPLVFDWGQGPQDLPHRTDGCVPRIGSIFRVIDLLTQICINVAKDILNCHVVPFMKCIYKRPGLAEAAAETVPNLERVKSWVAALLQAPTCQCTLWYVKIKTSLLTSPVDLIVNVS